MLVSLGFVLFILILILFGFNFNFNFNAYLVVAISEELCKKGVNAFCIIPFSLKMPILGIYNLLSEKMIKDFKNMIIS